MDSMTTGSTQNAHISLEDRVRVTFEIANILQKQALVQKLAKCLMQYGCPGHRIEYIMRTVSRTLQLDCEFVYVPNVMLTSFIDSTMHTTETRFIIQPQFFEMARLFEVYRLEKLLSHGEVTVDEALEFLDRVVVHDTVYPAWLNLFVYALASFCGCAMFYGGNWKEAGVSSALAVFFAIYELFSGRVVSLQPIYEITCCIIIGFISRGLELAGFCFVPMAFASFIIILPGYSMTLGISELVSRQLVSGVVRMVYAIMYSFLIGYGISMGSSLFELIDPADVSEFEHYCNTRNKNSNTCVTVVPQMFYLLTVPLFAVAYCVFLRARPARWPFMITLGITGFVINWALSCHASAPTQVIQVVPAFVVGFLGNLYTKITGKMSFDAVLLGVFYLVPGSLGLKAALGLFGGSAGSEFSNQGGGFALSMIETSIGISVGLFVATLLVYPKGSQHTPLMNF
ncbi:DUF1212-domain-containing protein [Hesseltinella vesiculosa]|uniref:DUF1212-domain-containing protein n=1 Tax=Hesseltinella vesiculosa TaxID=101127 RepID=A0A1X2G699_9FUNG|nr:DUF1212-domain-containing protein [Hesseltinella vesiculosa]